MIVLAEMTMEDEILDEGRDDWVSFSFINQCVGEYEGFEQGEPARSWRAVDVAAALVASGRIVAGDLTTSGFRSWYGDEHEVVARVRRDAADVIARHGYIALAEVCWFATPDLLARASP